MSTPYTLNKTDGTVLLTVASGASNSTYGVSFFGANYSGWGEALNENTIKLLENFANNTAPASSVEGQLWYDTGTSNLKVYNGSSYNQLPSFVRASSSPVGALGQLWLDSDNERLYVHNGTAFKAVTPGTIEFVGAQITGSGTMDPATGNYSIELTSSVSASNSFTNIAVSGNSTIVADSGVDTLTFVAGTGMVLTTDASIDSLTVAVDTASVLTGSNTINVAGIKTFTGALKATGTIELGGSTKAIYADQSIGADRPFIKWNSSSNYWELCNDGTTSAQIATGASAPNTAQYLTLTSDSTLTQERVLTAGTGISFADGGAGSTLTVTNSGVTSFNGATGAITNYAFGTIAVSGHSNVVADTGSDTLTIVAGTGITLSTNATTDTITISSSVTDTNTTYGISSESNASGAALRLTGNDSSTDEVVFLSGSGITITRTDASTITIATSGSSGITSAYTSISDGTNTATATGTDTIKFRGGTGVTTAVGSNDVTHGDNVLISVQDGTTSQKGIVQLSDSSASTSTALAATANLANTKLAKTGGTLSGALTISDSTASSSTTTGALIVTGGVGVGGNAYVGGNLVLSGNLTVNGTTTTVNSTTVTVDDPVFTLGGDTAPGSDDSKDRGIEFRYHNGTAAKTGFFGYDDSSGRFTFIPDATNSSEVFSGSVGDADFNVVYATANQARYADLAERYEADAFYEPGTVLVVGGEKEVTACNTYGDIKLAGIVSTNPAYLMNSNAGSDITHPAIALKGRVPIKVYGTVKKGDLLTTSPYAGHAEVAGDNVRDSAIIGIALSDNQTGSAVIEAMIK